MERIERCLVFDENELDERGMPKTREERQQIEEADIVLVKNAAGRLVSIRKARTLRQELPSSGCRLVKYGCECIGTEPNVEGMFILVQSCTNEECHDGLGLILRPLKGTIREDNQHNYVPLSVEEQTRHWQYINHLVRDGYELRMVRRILNPGT